MRIPAIIILLSVVSVTVFANTLPIGKDCKEFSLGVTGILAEIKGGSFRVTNVTPDTPATGKLLKGDTLLAVNGISLENMQTKGKHGDSLSKALETLKSSVQAWENEYGKLE